MSSVCSHCSKLGNWKIVCKRCKHVKYCSKKCMNFSFNVHNTICDPKTPVSDRLEMCRKLVDSKLKERPHLIVDAVTFTRDNNHTCTIINACIDNGNIIFKYQNSLIAGLKELTPISEGVMKFYTPEGIPDVKTHNGFPITINIVGNGKILYSYINLIEVGN